MINDPHLIHHTFLSLWLVIEEHIVGCGAMSAEGLSWRKKRIRQKQNLQPTWGPRVKQDVEVACGVLSGPTDAKGSHHRDVHVILPHDTISQRSDADCDNAVGGVCDAACPAGLTLLVGEDRDVGTLAVVGLGT